MDPSRKRTRFMAFFFSKPLKFLVLAGGLTACVQPYDVVLNADSEVLVVEATLTDQPGQLPFHLSRSLVQNGKVYGYPVKGAKMEVLVGGGGQVVPLTETDPSYYALPEGFRGNVGERYQLRFTLPDGRRYESTAEVLPAVPPVAKAYDRFDPKGIVNAEKTKYTPAHLIYLDLADPAGERNFYRWNFTFWERQQWCETCLGGYFAVTDSLTGGGACVSVRSPTPPLFDYECRTDCWDIFQGSELNLFADQYSDGRPLLGRVVARIPYFAANSTLVELRQYALTAAAYRYFKLLEDQTQNTGGLADTPPAPITGNIRNVQNPDEAVLGYFGASGVTVVRYWLERRNANTAPVGLFQAQFGRLPLPEPPNGPYPGIRPPTVRCVPGPTRTPLPPAGWRN